MNSSFHLVKCSRRVILILPITLPTLRRLTPSLDITTALRQAPPLHHRISCPQTSCRDIFPILPLELSLLMFDTSLTAPPENLPLPLLAPQRILRRRVRTSALYQLVSPVYHFFLNFQKTFVSSRRLFSVSIKLFPTSLNVLV